MRRLALVAALAVAACGSAAPASGLGSSVTVLAAASLSGAFTQIARSFEALHPGLRVRLDFGGSPTLVTQIEQGDRADVFASADQINMGNLEHAGLVAGTPQVFAHNRLEIVVQRGNPKHIESLADLARPGLVYVTTAPQVPAGHYAALALAAAHVRVTPKSEEVDVTAVLAKVELGEADAGIVYVTDVTSAGGKVTGVPIPSADNQVATYPLAVIRGAPDERAAKAFVAYVTSRAGQATLKAYGFAPA